MYSVFFSSALTIRYNAVEEFNIDSKAE